MNRCDCIDYVGRLGWQANNRCKRIDYEPCSSTSNSPQKLGLLIRATRKQQKFRMEGVVGNAGADPVFVRDMERGKETVQLEHVMQIPSNLSIELKADVPNDVMPALAALNASGVKPVLRRQPPARISLANCACCERSGTSCWPTCAGNCRCLTAPDPETYRTSAA